MTKKLHARGFTIIEVVIVLALAAFIFTIVFFAVPQLQKSLRNSQRERDVSAVHAEILNYKEVNGKIPYGYPERADFNARYMSTLDLKDPVSGEGYLFAHAYPVAGGSNLPANSRWVYMVGGAECDGSKGIKNIELSKLRAKFLTIMQNESGNGYICKDLE